MNEQEIRAEQLADLRKMLGQPEGRRFILRLLNDVCCIRKSVMRSNPMAQVSERVVYNAGKQDIGKWLEDEADEAAPLALDLARGEAYARKQLEKPKDKKPDEENENA